MTPLIRVLLGMSKPSDKISINGLKFHEDTLNVSQKEAVRFALESPEVACIHGPPGMLIYHFTMTQHCNTIYCQERGKHIHSLKLSAS